ncbi:MAG: hypothetical protein Q7S79_01740 [bacterium]|nr:hypothetical protein [bacterium]
MERENRFAAAMDRLRERAGDYVEKVMSAMVESTINEPVTKPQELPKHLDYGNFPDSHLSPSDLELRRLYEGELKESLDRNGWASRISE